MKQRKDPLVNGNYYHIYSRSIAKYEIFNDTNDFTRIINLLDLYRYTEFKHKYSQFVELELENQQAVINRLRKSSELLVEIVSYCIMPTHIHLVLKQVVEHGITKYIGTVFNSYSRYFNTKYHRTGPLWASRFKSVLVDKDEYLLNLTRYIHLNPTSAGLVDKINDWPHSSYNVYISNEKQSNLININGLFDISAKDYQKFVLDRKAYQQQLSQIKHLLIDNYSG